MKFIPGTESHFENTPQMCWELDHGVWTLRVWWNGKAPVTWEGITVTVIHGGDCPRVVKDLAHKKGMGLAWAEVRKRAKNRNQLELF